MSKNLQFNFESLNKYEDKYWVPVYKIMLVKKSNQPAYVQTVTKPKDAFELAKNYLFEVDRKHFVIFMLDIGKKVIGINTVSIGTLVNCPAHPHLSRHRPSLQTSLMECDTQ